MGTENKDRSFGDEGVEGLDMGLKYGMHNMVTEKEQTTPLDLGRGQVRWALSKSSWPHYRVKPS